MDNKIDITRYKICNLKIPEEFNGFKIVQISDLHNKKFLDEDILLKKVKKLNPHIVVITGDSINGNDKNFDNAYQIIKKLSDEYIVYNINGNHELKIEKNNLKSNYEIYFDKLKKSNVVDLNNKNIKIKKGNSYINLYGIEIPIDYYIYSIKDMKNKNKSLDNLYDFNIDKNQYNILLSHNPFYFEDYAKWNFDLVFCGHVHGGIIRIPKLGGLLSPTREFFPKYDWGIYKLKDSSMIVNKGIGNGSLIQRIRCNPEIVLVELATSN